MSDVTIFAPSPTLTITLENHGGADQIHLHAGGQGVWQARMLRRLGVSVTMCSGLTGESGQVVRHLLQDDQIKVLGVQREGRASAYIHDRRAGARTIIGEELGDPLDRHDLDELYTLTLREGMRSGHVILSGPADRDALPADTYRRLAADLREAGCTVIVDLAGERLAAALAGGVHLLKVSDDELRESGLLGDDADVASLAQVMSTLRERGADIVVVTRAARPFLLLDAEGLLEITGPKMQELDSSGAGDSLTAGVVAGLIRGESARSAVTLGAAAGAMNVTRHGLGSGNAEAIMRLRTAVRTRRLNRDGSAHSEDDSQRVSPDGLAARVAPSEVSADRPLQNEGSEAGA